MGLEPTDRRFRGRPRAAGRRIAGRARARGRQVPARGRGEVLGQGRDLRSLRPTRRRALPARAGADGQGPRANPRSWRQHHPCLPSTHPRGPRPRPRPRPQGAGRRALVEAPLLHAEPRRPGERTTRRARGRADGQGTPRGPRLQRPDGDRPDGRTARRGPARAAGHLDRRHRRHPLRLLQGQGPAGARDRGRARAGLAVACHPVP